MSDEKPVNVDPLVETVSPEPPQIDYVAHVRTFNRFVNLVKWFCVHMFFVLASLYFLIIAHQPIFGTVLLVVAVLLLVYGITRNPNVNRDMDEGFANMKPAE